MFNFFLKKELTDRYLGSSSALIWVILQPIATLFTYYLVFGLIFKSRIVGIPDNAFITYLAIGLWPWMAFSESVLASIDSIISRKDLLGKVKIDMRHIVVSGTSATFLLHGIGFLVILMLLIIFDRLEVGFNLFLLIYPLLILYVLAIAISLILSALQVFYRDAKQIISSLLPLLFFCTPIIYSFAYIPEKVQKYFLLNPLVSVIEFIHNAVFNTELLTWYATTSVLVFSILLLILANIFFNKLAPRFDDFV